MSVSFATEVRRGASGVRTAVESWSGGRLTAGELPCQEDDGVGGVYLPVIVDIGGLDTDDAGPPR